MFSNHVSQTANETAYFIEKEKYTCYGFILSIILVDIKREHLYLDMFFFVNLGKYFFTRIKDVYTLKTK